MIHMVMRGQAAIEFMFFIAIIIILLTVAFVFSSGANADTTNLGRKFEAENVCQHFATLISTVATSGNGTVVEYLLPPYIGGNNYTVYVNGSTITITVDYTRGSQTCPVPTANFTSIVIANRTGFIRNLGDGVFID